MSENDVPNPPPKLGGARGGLNAAIAQALVEYHRKAVGRGPTKARAFYRDNIVVVIVEDLLTTFERSLLHAGKKRVVLEERAELQAAMRQDFVTAVEKLTGRGVLAFMSANHIDPDMGCEVFVLDGPVIAEPAAPPTPI